MNVTKINGPFGVPIYIENTPADCKSVAMSWVIFTGAADDEVVGKPGLYHWLEHLPFEGTHQFPNGYEDIQGRFIKYGGRIGGRTKLHFTCYTVNVPVRFWKESLRVLTDLWSRPLLDTIAADHERSIIMGEINEMMSNSKKIIDSLLPSILYKGHPFGHSVLGTKTDLSSMESGTVIKAWQEGYDYARASLFISGNIPEIELCDELEILKNIFANHHLSTRRAPLSRGPLPWVSQLVTVNVPLTSTQVVQLIPLPCVKPAEHKKQLINTTILRSLFTFGLGCSPLYKIVREEYGLSHSTRPLQLNIGGGGYLGFCAEISEDGVEHARGALQEVWKSEELLSKERFEAVQQGIECMIEMEPMDTIASNKKLVDRFCNCGEIVTNEDILLSIKAMSHEDALRLYNEFITLNLNNMSTIVFQGKDTLEISSE